MFNHTSFCKAPRISWTNWGQLYLKRNKYKKTKNEKIFTFGIANAGAIGKSIGSVAASWNAKILACGLTPSLSASSGVVNKTAAAPSFKVDALPAVTVPFSLWIGTK